MPADGGRRGPGGPGGVDLGHALMLPPDGAVDYLRAKGYKVSWRWWELWQEAHARAFTVAKMARSDLLAQTRAIVDRALATGMSERQAAGALESALRRAGWWGRQIVVDDNGVAEKVQLGSPRRLKTILRTNWQVAYAAGRYARQRETRDSRPFWMYVAVQDGATRDRHRALHGTVMRADDPAWDAVYPPNGFNCRCRVRALTAAQVEAIGLRPLDGVRVEDVQHEMGVRPKTGGVVTLPGRRIVWRAGREKRSFAPDPGWSHRPGAGGLDRPKGGRPDPEDPDWKTWARRPARDLDTAPPAPPAAVVEPPRVGDRSRVRTLTGSAQSAQPFLRTPVERVSIPRRRADDADLLAALSDPDEVWLTHFPGEPKGRRAEYRTTYLRTTAAGGTLVTVHPDGTLRMESPTRDRLDGRRRGALLHARDRDAEAAAADDRDEPTRNAERDAIFARQQAGRAEKLWQEALPGTSRRAAARKLANATWAGAEEALGRFEKAWEARRAAVPDIDTASPQAAAVLREARAALDDPKLTDEQRRTRLQAIFSRPVDPELAGRVHLQKEHALAVEQWTQYVSPPLARRIGRVRLAPEAERGGYSRAVRLGPDETVLNVLPDTEPKVVIHELGHAVEYSSDALAAETAALLGRRARGIGTLDDSDDHYFQGFGRWDKGDDEDAYLDRYTGLIYPAAEGPRFFQPRDDVVVDTTTEVVSMGLQRLADDPVYLARTDWDLFSFLIRRVVWR